MSNDDGELRTMLQHRQHYVVKNKLLYKEIQSLQREASSLQFVLPQKFRKQAITACHNDVGHLGVEMSLDLLKDRFYWPNVASKVESHIRKCERCLKYEAETQRAEFSPIMSTHPMDMVHMDFMMTKSCKPKDNLPGSTKKVISMLVVTEHFTKYAQTFVTPSQTTKVVAQTLWENYFVHYGFPEKLLSDKGANFESSYIL